MNRRVGREINKIFRTLLIAASLSAISGFPCSAATLPELNQLTDILRTYNFVSGENVTLNEKMGTTASGAFEILGKNVSSNSILFNQFSGFVISRIQTTLTLSNLTLSGALSNIGSVIYNIASDSVINLTNLSIENNTVSTAGNAYGGAIYTDNSLTMKNVSLKGNSAVTTGEDTVAQGGAIYAQNSVSMIADSDNVVIIDNYTEDSTGTNDNAIYMANSSSQLDIRVQNEGRMDIHDGIDGSSGYKVNITGDGTGTVGLYNSIKNGEVNVSDVDVTMADGETNNHIVDNLTIGDEVTFTVDVDFANEKADTLTSENGSGVLNLSGISILSLPSEDEAKVQILKDAGSITLNIDKLKSNLVTDLQATMYNSNILAGSLTLGQTDTENDSIIISNLKDILYEMVKDTNPLHMVKNFVFNTDTEYTLTKDLEETPQESILTIYNTSDSDYGVINANGHSMFKMKNPVTSVTLDDITIKNAKTSENGSVAYLENNTATFSANNSLITENSSQGDGGAIYVKTGTVSMENSQVTNNSAGGDGGAIYSIGESKVELTNTDFKNNTAGGKGGAIYTESELTIIANKGTSTFEGNSANGENNAIYAGSSDANITLKAQNSGKINMNDKISGTENGYNLNITGNSTGNVNINNTVENANITLSGTNLNLAQDDLLKGNSMNAKGGAINMINGEIGNTDFSKLSTSGTTKVKVDVDLANKTMDRITADKYSNIKGTVNVSKMHLLSDAKSTKTKVYFADSPLRYHVKTTVKTVSYSRVYRYLVSYNPSDGYFLFNRGTGYDDMSFNPAVLSGAVAQQTAYMNQLQNYQTAMYHLDTYMSLPKRVRMSMYSNSYADASYDTSQSTMTHITVPEEVKSIWVRPYTSFESIPLHRGPKVSSINYGTLAGGESDMIQLGHGFSLVYGGYMGYNGNTYHYTDVHATQQGAVLGAIAYLYKGNFFNALTADVGWMINDSDTIYGSDTMNMIMSGFSDKFGYNIEISGGKVIIQPSLTMGYSFVYTTDYTSSNNVRIESDPLNVMHFIPGIKVIGNLANGWQPYALINIICNFSDKSNFTADNIQLPEMSINPYVEYGIGVQKRWDDKYSGFAQATVRNGGRRGAALLVGFRCMMGKLKNTVFTPHEDAKPKKTTFKEKKTPDFIVENIKPKYTKPEKQPVTKIAKEQKKKRGLSIVNFFKNIKKRMVYQYNTDVSAMVVTDVYSDGVIVSEVGSEKGETVTVTEDVDGNIEEIKGEHLVEGENNTIEEDIEVKEIIKKSVSTPINHTVKPVSQQIIRTPQKTETEIKPTDKPSTVESQKTQVEQKPVAKKTDTIRRVRKKLRKIMNINQEKLKKPVKTDSYSDFLLEFVNIKF